MDFNITGSKTWGIKDQFLDNLHNQLFAKSELKFKLEEGDRKRKNKRKTKTYQSSETQLCDSDIQNGASIEKFNLNSLKKQQLCNVQDGSIDNFSENHSLGISSKCNKKRKKHERELENSESIRSKSKKVNKRNKFKPQNAVNAIISDTPISNFDTNCKKVNLAKNAKKIEVKKMQSEGPGDIEQVNHNLSDAHTNKTSLVTKPIPENHSLGISSKCNKKRKTHERELENSKSIRSQSKKVNKRNKFKPQNAVNAIISDTPIPNFDTNCKKVNLAENAKKRKVKKMQSEGPSDTEQVNHNLSAIHTSKTSLVTKSIPAFHTNAPEDLTKEVKKKKSRRKGKKRNLDMDPDDNPTEIESLVDAPRHKRLKINPSTLQHILEKHNASVSAQKLKQKSNSAQTNLPPISKSTLLKEKTMKSFQAAKFRLINEKLYTVKGNEAFEYFSNNTGAFEDYHEGYRCQVSKWPINPVDIIIEDLHKSPKSLIIADLGCGDAKIAKAFPQRKVHSFDLVASNDLVTPCNFSKVPLGNDIVDVAVFCLSLMGVNLNDYIREARRILKIGGMLKIAEVESRIESLPTFIHDIEKHGFSIDRKDVKHKMFTFLDFNKVKKKLKTGNLPTIKLNPCMYKKR